MRILLITQWFDPEPTFKGLLFAKELQSLGHEVEVLTGFPNYPGGRVYSGYSLRPWQREVIDGVPVLRMPLYPSHDSSGCKRTANYLSFAISATVGSLLLRRPDVAYVYHPPATVSLPALVLRVLKSVPFVYDIQDLWPDTLAATGMMEHPAVLNIVEIGMQHIYKRASRIAVLSNGFKDKLMERGVPERKISVIPNWTDEAQIQLPEPNPVRAAELGFADRFNVVFAGTMGKAQALDTVLDAADLLKSQAPAARFVLIGGGIEVEGLKQRAAERRLPNIVFLPRRPPSEIGEILGMADALLVHLKDDPLFAITIPSKTQAYLMTGKPVLMGVRGDAAQMVAQAGAGVAFEPQNAQQLAVAVQQLMQLGLTQRQAMGEAGGIYYQKHLSLATGTQQFAMLLQQAADQVRPYDALKRVMDIIGAGVGLIILGVPMVALTWMVRSKLGSPILFKQVRPGLDGQPFTMYKFRTMTDERGSDGALLSDEVRLTSFGKFLRSTSLDELPELWNVLKGDMSLVGPRPLLMSYLTLYNERQYRRHEVRPGVTGWAQVNGRNALSWEQKFEYDVWYVENRSLLLDLRILAMTLQKVLIREGISAAGVATMPEFRGET